MAIWKCVWFSINIAGRPNKQIAAQAELSEMTVPDTVSPQMRAAIAAPYRSPGLNPRDAAEWRQTVAQLAAPEAAAQPALREKLGVSIESTQIGGVPASC